MKSIIISEKLHDEMRHFSIESKMRLSAIAESAIKKFITPQNFSIDNEALETLINRVAESRGVDSKVLINKILLEQISEMIKSDKGL